MGMSGRETQGLPAVDDILTQSQGDIRDPIFRLLVTDRIEIQGTGHARHRRIEMIIITGAHHFLQDDSHLLLIDQVRGSRHIRLTVLIKDRGIHRLDSVAHRTEHIVFLLDLRYHIRRIDPGERLIMRIFQQAGGTHGDRAFHHIEESHQVLD